MCSHSVAAMICLTYGGFILQGGHTAQPQHKQCQHHHFAILQLHYTIQNVALTHHIIIRLICGPIVEICWSHDIGYVMLHAVVVKSYSTSLFTGLFTGAPNYDTVHVCSCLSILILNRGVQSYSFFLNEPCKHIIIQRYSCHLIVHYRFAIK